MKRNLIKQMGNAWRDNLWIVVGLSIVILVIWSFSNSLYQAAMGYFFPLGFDEENVMVFAVDRIPQDSSEYIATEEEAGVAYSNDLRNLLKRVRESPYVEAAGLSKNGTPYLLSSYSTSARYIRPDNDTVYYSGNRRYMSPEVIDVLHRESLTGKDAAYLRKKLEEGDILIAHQYEDYDYVINGDELEGKNVEIKEYNWQNGGESSYVKYHVGDIVVMVQRSRYDYPWSGEMTAPIDESGDISDIGEVLLRVKPGCMWKFREEYESSPDMIQSGNVTLGNLQSLAEMGKMTDRYWSLDVRLYSVVIGFILLIIFLGLLGTFWFRMQQRVGEIAIRRVCGATKFDIFRRMISEGMVLLGIAALISSIIGWIYIYRMYVASLSENYMTFNMKVYFWLEVATLVLVAIGIILSITVPAWQAMNIKPAEAVKDE